MAELSSYRHQEIEKYLRQQMSPQEMHDFEKALMSDPFLADALEGYQSADHALAKQHLNELETQIINNREKARVIPSKGKGMPWWKVAAIVLFVISSGAITYSILNNKLAIGERTEKAIATNLEKAITEDSPSTGDNQIAGTEHLGAKEQNTERSMAVANEDKKTLLSGNRISSESLAAKANKPAKSLQPRIASPPEIATVERQNREGSFKNDLGANEPVAADETATNDLAANTSPRSIPMQTKQRSTTTGIATENSDSGLMNENPKDKEYRENSEELSLAETIVRSKIKNKNTTVVIIDTAIQAQPLNGWKNFLKYMEAQLDSFSATQSTGLPQKVVVEFLPANNGSPTQVTATGSESTKIQKAIEAVRNGPLWTNFQKDKKVKVIISF